MRNIHFETDYIKNPAGSCLASFGDTRVICTATIESKVPPFLEGKGTGWLTAEYAMLPGSTGGGRKRRDGAKRDGRGVEISRLIGRSLRAAIDLASLGETSIVIDCDVLQADGGTRTAAISGGWVALYRALQKLAEIQGTSGPEAYLLGQVARFRGGRDSPNTRSPAKSPGNLLRNRRARLNNRRAHVSSLTHYRSR